RGVARRSRRARDAAPGGPADRTQRTDRVPGVRARLAFRQDSKGVSEFFARLRYGHNASGTAAFGFASEDVDALWSFFEDVRGYECVEQAVAKLRIERP